MFKPLSKFTSHIKEWNKSIYYFIGTRKKRLMKSLLHIQSALERSSSYRLMQLESDVRDELENLLDDEELLWKQKAQCDWLQLGDRNTKFYHNRTVQHRKYNRINTLRIPSGEWCSDQDILRAEAVPFFENLFGERMKPIKGLPFNIFPKFNDLDVTFLERGVSDEEIKKALFDMAPLKAPGSDSFHAHFFQSQWNTVGGAVCQWVKGVFDGIFINPTLKIH